MTDSKERDEPSSADIDPSPEPLVTWERIFALLIGFICGGAGGYTVFERSNQAGTVMLLVLAAIFLLIGIQGTPLIKFGSTSASVELERRRRAKVQQALEEATEDDNADRAEGIVEGVKLVAPELVPRSLTDIREYENNLAGIISNMGYHVTQEARLPSMIVDLVITKDSYTIYGELKIYRTPIPVTVANQVIGMSTILSAPVLLIATSPLSNSAKNLIDNTNRVAFVQWRDDRDNTILNATLKRLFDKPSQNNLT